MECITECLLTESRPHRAVAHLTAPDGDVQPYPLSRQVLEHHKGAVVLVVDDLPIRRTG